MAPRNKRSAGQPDDGIVANELPVGEGDTLENGVAGSAAGDPASEPASESDAAPGAPVAAEEEGHREEPSLDTPVAGRRGLEEDEHVLVDHSAEHTSEEHPAGQEDPVVPQPQPGVTPGEPEPSVPGAGEPGSSVPGPKDKYEGSRDISKDETYVRVKKILKDNSLTVDERLEKISATSNIEYKVIVEKFKEFDALMIKENEAVLSPYEFGNKVSGIYKMLDAILQIEDTYECFVKLQVVVLNFKKYCNTSLAYTFYALYHEAYPGGEIEYLNYMYIMATLSNIAAGDDYDILKRNINFDRADFIHGKKLEEFAISLS
jgi:hypothetical protein